VLEELGVVAEQERPFVLADGQEVHYPTAWIQIQLQGRQGPTIVVFAPPGSEPILGAVTLAGFCLAADPVNERLIPVPARAKRSTSPDAELYAVS
jgi:predicted aspartyl protease